MIRSSIFLTELLLSVTSGSAHLLNGIWLELRVRGRVPDSRTGFAGMGSDHKNLRRRFRAQRTTISSREAGFKILLAEENLS